MGDTVKPRYIGPDGRWQSPYLAPPDDNMLAHLPRLVYAGPLGARKEWNRWNWKFAGSREMCIYHLFNSDGEPLYFGKAWCPLYRFEKHQRKPWWPAVAHLNLYKVTCESHRQKPCRSDLDHVAIEWEHYAIARVKPVHNKAAKPVEVA